MKKYTGMYKVVALLFMTILMAGWSDGDCVKSSKSTSGESCAIWVVTDQEIKKLAPDGTVLVNLTSVFDKGFNFPPNSPDIMGIDKFDYIWFGLYQHL